MSGHLTITEVGLRDGLQTLSAFIPTAAKRELLAALAQAGLRSIEATSFVSPRAVPQLSDAEALFTSGEALGIARLSALVPNRRGLERAMMAGVREIAVVVAATETLNQRNIRMSLAQALDEGAATLAQARSLGLATRGYVAVALGCPYEGEVTQSQALAVAERLRAAGAQEVVLADTIGAAGPGQVKRLFRTAAGVLGADVLAGHFHDTRGLGLANVCAALDAGVTRFDSSVGGLGGCPFAPGAAGNLATEDLVVLARQEGLETGVDLAAMVRAVDTAMAITGQPLGGRSLGWLRRGVPPQAQPHSQSH
ncbi:MAG: hydroxymethylglutaryl-CoA lyase [Comamonadaceae bacterium]|nr:MAG: hydroxymethylglutaryl-CoA lyase [Comamonadaceae bacterium]